MHLIPYDTRIDFLRLRNVAIGIAAAMLIASIALLATRGLNFALDFTGGTMAELQFDKPVDMDGVRDKLEAAGYENAVVQAFGSESDIVVRLQPQAGQANAAQTGSAVLAAVQTPDNPGRVIASDFVSAQVGKELAQNGVLAIVFVTFGFIIYISMRFEWKFAVAAIITTIFDVICTIGLFSLTQHQFDLSVMAGVMSVMGYSINDTIVVFDRVRENFRSLRVEPLEVMNRSINQTLSRTIITSLVFFLSVLALYLYGGGSLEGLALSQMIGAVIGTLSSIFIACPMLTVGPLKVTKQDLLPKAKDEEALARRP